MQVSADLSSKIALLSRFEKNTAETSAFFSYLYDDRIGQH